MMKTLFMSGTTSLLLASARLYLATGNPRNKCLSQKALYKLLCLNIDLWLSVDLLIYLSGLVDGMKGGRTASGWRVCTRCIRAKLYLIYKLNDTYLKKHWTFSRFLTLFSVCSSAVTKTTTSLADSIVIYLNTQLALIQRSQN